MEKEWGNGEKMRECREWISLHFLILSPLPLHFCILSPFSHSQAGRLSQLVQAWNYEYRMTPGFLINSTSRLAAELLSRTVLPPRFNSIRHTNSTSPSNDWTDWTRGSGTFHRRLTETYNNNSTKLIFHDLRFISVLADELLLSAPQPTFKHDGFNGITYTFSNCSLLHKLLITSQGEQLVSRRGELNGDLLSSTCEVDRVTKVRCKIGLMKFLTYTGTK